MDDSENVFRKVEESTPKKDFQYVVWEGFAVSLDELNLIQSLLQSESLRTQFLKLISQSVPISNENGELAAEKLTYSKILGTRIDGLNFFLQALQKGHYPPAKNERVRKMTQEEGVLFTSLKKAVVGNRHKMSSVDSLSSGEVAESLKTAKTYDYDSALIDAAYPLLLPQYRSDEQFMTLMTFPLLKGNGLHQDERQGFQYEGKALDEYLQLVAKQRAGIRWGINSDIVKDRKYSFSKGHFYGKDITSKEIEVRHSSGFFPTRDIAFALTKPNTLERKIVEVCQIKTPVKS